MTRKLMHVREIEAMAREDQAASDAAEIEMAMLPSWAWLQRAKVKLRMHAHAYAAARLRSVMTGHKEATK